MINALFVEKNGVYYGLDNVDPWDIERDAMTYKGNDPVIAHPPCQLWGKMAKVNYARWGGEHNKPGNDGGMFKFSLDTVNRCGGVLEHPSMTYAWGEYELTKPIANQWTKSGYGWVCEVWQSAYGHKANKSTWLYYVGPKPFDLNWSKPSGSHQIGYRDYKRPAHKMKPTLSKKEVNKTPIPFRDLLINLVQLNLTRR